MKPADVMIATKIKYRTFMSDIMLGSLGGLSSVFGDQYLDLTMDSQC